MAKWLHISQDCILWQTSELCDLFSGCCFIFTTEVWSWRKCPGQYKLYAALQPMALGQATSCDEQVKKMLNDDITEPSYSPWASQAVLVTDRDSFLCWLRSVDGQSFARLTVAALSGLFRWYHCFHGKTGMDTDARNFAMGAVLPYVQNDE